MPRSPRTHTSPWSIATAAVSGLVLAALAAALSGCSQAPPATVTLVATSGTLTVAPGSSASLALQVTPEQGFTGTLSLQLVDAQGRAVGGLDVTPGNLTVTGTDPLLAGLTVAAAGATALGDYQLRLELTGSGVSASVPLDVSVQPAPPPDFMVAASPLAVTATVGGSAALTVMIGSQDGFAGTVALVALDASGAVAGGVTLSPAKITVSAGQLVSRAVTVSLDASVPAGGYPLELEATAGGLVHGVAVTLDVRQGGFQAHIDYPVGQDPEDVTVADLNGDGSPDLITADRLGGAVSVLLGNGDGTFQTAVTTYLAVGQLPNAVVAADLNGDGNLDLIVASGGPASDVSVLLGLGDGSFQGPVTYATGADPYRVRAADVNGDGAPDLITTDYNASAVSVLLGNGDGTFAGHVDYPTGVTPAGLALVALDGDGVLDVATANASGTVSVLLGNGDGTFQPKQDMLVGLVDFGFTSADVNADGNADLVAASSTNAAGVLAVLLGNGDGTLQAGTLVDTGTFTRVVTSGDLTGNGRVDLVTVDQGGTNLGVLLFAGNGDGTFQPAVTYPVASGSTPTAVAVADLNRDGKPDLVVANSDNGGVVNAVSVLLGR